MQASKTFLSASWEHLMMINFEADPSILQPYIPKYTELDLFNGKALVSVVGFMFKNVKVFGIKWPGHINFEEVNLRIYIKHFDGLAYRRGVVFVSEIVPRPVIATLANLLYHEQYKAMPMKHLLLADKETITVNYEWKHRGTWNSMGVNAANKPAEIGPGSGEEFIFEHYWGYNQYNKHTTIEYGVEHERWQVYPVNNWSLNCDVAALYGEAFVPILSQKPFSVFLAKGSDVIIRKPRFIKNAVG